MSRAAARIVAAEVEMASFPRFHQQHGPAFDAEPVGEDQIAAYRGKLPDAILEDWREHGRCGYHDGFLWTVDPDDLSEWLAEGQYAFLRTAFGGVFYWDGQNAHYLDIID